MNHAELQIPLKTKSFSLKEFLKILVVVVFSLSQIDRLVKRFSGFVSYSSGS